MEDVATEPLALHRDSMEQQQVDWCSIQCGRSTKIEAEEGASVDVAFSCTRQDERCHGPCRPQARSRVHPRIAKESPIVLWQDRNIAVISKGPGWFVTLSRQMLDTKRRYLPELYSAHGVRDLVDSEFCEHLAHYIQGKFGEDEEYELANDPEYEFGIVHRLDIDTSGALLIGKTVKGFQHLRSMLFAHDLLKAYVCMVHGLLEATTDSIEAPIAFDEERNKSTISETDGKWAKSVYTVVARYRMPIDGRGFTLCRVQIVTGRTHQIRVHMASIGHPVVSDSKYCSFSANDRDWCPRLFLHASHVGFEDLDHVYHEVKAPLSKDLLFALGSLKEIENYDNTPDSNFCLSTSQLPSSVRPLCQAPVSRTSRDVRSAFRANSRRSASAPPAHWRQQEVYSGQRHRDCGSFHKGEFDLNLDVSVGCRADELHHAQDINTLAAQRVLRCVGDVWNRRRRATFDLGLRNRRPSERWRTAVERCADKIGTSVVEQPCALGRSRCMTSDSWHSSRDREHWGVDCVARVSRALGQRHDDWRHCGCIADGPWWAEDAWGEWHIAAESQPDSTDRSFWKAVEDCDQLSSRGASRLKGRSACWHDWDADARDWLAGEWESAQGWHCGTIAPSAMCKHGLTELDAGWHHRSAAGPPVRCLSLELDVGWQRDRSSRSSVGDRRNWKCESLWLQGGTPCSSVQCHGSCERDPEWCFSDVACSATDDDRNWERKLCWLCGGSVCPQPDDNGNAECNLCWEGCGVARSSSDDGRWELDADQWCDKVAHLSVKHLEHREVDASHGCGAVVPTAAGDGNWACDSGWRSAATVYTTADDQESWKERSSWRQGSVAGWAIEGWWCDNMRDAGW